MDVVDRRRTVCLPGRNPSLRLKRLVRHDHRREIVIGLLAVLWIFNVLGVVVLVASLIAHSAIHITGAQLLASGGALWLTDAIAFGLAFWELDCGGPVTRALATGPRKPDFQFPKTRTPSSPATVGLRVSGTISMCR